MEVPPASEFDQIGFGISAFVELVKNIFEVVAIGAGGIWTYFNFFKGRTYRPRLECSVDGSVEEHSGQRFLKVIVRAKNVGLSKVPIEQKGTILQLYESVLSSSSPQFPFQATWADSPAVFDVFKEHAWVEPSEPVEDHVLIELPRNGVPAYKLNLKVLSKKISWTARNVVYGSERRQKEASMAKAQDQMPADVAEHLELQKQRAEQKRKEEQRRGAGEKTRTPENEK